MECLFGGEVSEEDISSSLEGSGSSTPNEQEIRDCFAPLYNTGGASDTTTEPGSGSTGEPEATTMDEGTSDDGDNSADSGTSEANDGSN
jgi:hypothetical protein